MKYVQNTVTIRGGNKMQISVSKLDVRTKHSSHIFSELERGTRNEVLCTTR